MKLYGDNGDAEGLKMKVSHALLWITDLPDCPALYALCGGTGKRAAHCICWGHRSLKRRAAQHLLTRHSSVATGTSAVGQSTPIM